MPDLAILRSIELFQNLDPVQLAHVASIVEERKVPKNTVLFKEHDVSTEFFIIQKGRVRISKVVPGFGEEALAILDSGAYFGEMEMIDKETPRAAQALAHEECILQVMKYDDFHGLLRTDKELAVAVLWNFVRTLSRRLHATDDKVAATFAMAQFK